MSNAASRKLQQHFIDIGEAATRTWLVGTKCSIKDQQRKIAAAENVLRSLARARARKTKKTQDQPLHAIAEANLDPVKQREALAA